MKLSRPKKSGSGLSKIIIINLSDTKEISRRLRQQKDKLRREQQENGYDPE